MSSFAQEVTRTSLVSSEPQLSEFRELVERQPPACNLAVELIHRVPVYDCPALLELDSERIIDLQIEWAQVLKHGAGIVYLRQVLKAEVVDEANRIFFSILSEQKEDAEHFADQSANERLWNALQKLCLKAPKTFIKYYANPFLTLISQAWLGNGYQLTSQINNVRPGGKAQQVHRDYHLGSFHKQQAQAFPIQQHFVSQFLTLQGVVAHCDMSIESGVTKLLPCSQLYDKGYVAMHETDFQEYFEENYVQLPFKKGDAVFFNPALFHAAGENKTSHVQRLANLLQVSSAFGRTMESVDRLKMALKLYPHLLELEDSVAVLAVKNSLEGYAFPTNLDTDPPPQGALANNESPADLTLRALQEKWSFEAFSSAIEKKYAQRAA